MPTDHGWPDYDKPVPAAEDVACEHPKNAVTWNEFNGVVQCHHCGHVDGIATYAKGFQDGFAHIAERIKLLIDHEANEAIPALIDGSGCGP